MRKQGLSAQVAKQVLAQHSERTVVDVLDNSQEVDSLLAIYVKALLNEISERARQSHLRCPDDLGSEDDY